MNKSQQYLPPAACLLACLLALWALLPPAPAHATPQTATNPAFTQAACAACHSDPDLRAATVRGMGLQLHVPLYDYERSAHGAMNCVTCHVSGDAKGAEWSDFAVIPHKLDREALPSCLNCHDKTFAHIVKQAGESVHFEKQGAKIACLDCHNPHTQRRLSPMDSYAGGVKAANTPCVDCHTGNVRYKELTGRAVYSQNISHDFLPEPDRHFAAVRCVECHSGTDAANPRPHRILPKSEALRDCKSCHTDSGSLLSTRAALYTTPSLGGGGFTNRGLFDDASLIKRMDEFKIDLKTMTPLSFAVPSESAARAAFGGEYVPGFHQTAWLDKEGGPLLLIVLALCVLHGVIRLLTRGKRPAPAAQGGGAERLYPNTVRILHWTNAVCFVVLMITGFSIHFTPAGLPLEFSVNAHNIFGVLLTANFLVFLLYNLFTGEYDQYLGFPKGWLPLFFRQIDHYLRGIFTGAEKPHHATPERRLNPVQQLTYLIFYCAGMFAMLLSGLLLLMPELAALITPDWSRVCLAAAHYALALGYTAFLIIHLYMITTGSRITSLLKGMLSGRKYE